MNSEKECLMPPKQASSPNLSSQGEQALTAYENHLWHEADLRPVSIRDYMSDLRLFMAWCERDWSDGNEGEIAFSPENVATPTIIRYRDYLQNDLGRKPATINRYLISIKRYFSWAVAQELVLRDPAQVVKYIPQTPRPPAHLSDKEESNLMAAVNASKKSRDRTLIVLMLHTGLRVSEVCQLKWEDFVIGERSGRVSVKGKGNKYREVPLNSTVRQAIQEYQEDVDVSGEYVFVSQKTQKNLTARGVSFVVKKYAQKAGLPHLRPHDLRHRFGYRMAERVPIHRLAQIMGHDSLDTTMIYIRGTQSDLQQAVESIAWE
jgi:integrase/recombinase XerD